MATNGGPAFPTPAEVNPVSLPLPHPEAYEGEPREYARALMERKDQIEAEIDALKGVLASHGATTETSLFDPEGYPRGDIDIYAIRHARAALARLNTDRREVNNLLATALEAAFAPGPSSTSVNTTGSNQAKPAANGHAPNPVTGTRSSGEEDWPSKPVARVNTVASGSPAAEAGLQAGDTIYSFGDVTSDTPRGLQAVGSLVAGSEGSSISLKISRGEGEGQRIRLTITPRTGWGGRGSLGCHILPA